MTIRLRFVTGTSIVSHVIRAAELGFWASHVEALTPDGKSYVGAHLTGGVLSRPVEYDKDTWEKQLIVTIPATDSQTKIFYDFLHSQIGKEYDMDAIGEMALGAITSQVINFESDKWICSALQAAALRKANIIGSLCTPLHVTTPRDVLCICSGLSNEIIGEPETKTS